MRLQYHTLLLSLILTGILASPRPRYIQHTLKFHFVRCLRVFTLRHRHHFCKDGLRIDARRALKSIRSHEHTTQLANCKAKYIYNHNLKRLPEVIPEIVCSSGAGNHCIQIELPMKAAFLQPDGQYVEKTTYVPSGCIDSRATTLGR